MLNTSRRKNTRRHKRFDIFDIFPFMFGFALIGVFLIIFASIMFDIYFGEGPLMYLLTIVVVSGIGMMIKELLGG